jgi:hypothetical protein
MSLWWCTKCKCLVGGSNTTCTCPTCGTWLSYAQVTPPPTLPTPKICWCQTLYQSGMSQSSRCSACIAKEWAEQKVRITELEAELDNLYRQRAYEPD